jgi:hypothetical protein
MADLEDGHDRLKLIDQIKNPPSRLSLPWPEALLPDLHSAKDLAILRCESVPLGI